MSAKEYYVKWKNEASWLEINRPKDFNARGIRAAGEMYYAPRRAPFLLVNSIRDGTEALPAVAQSLANTIQKYSSVPLLRS